MFGDLITKRIPPDKRAGKCDGSSELYLSEGAVMIAFAMHLLRTVPDLSQVAIHPDGEHGKRFDFRAWLEKWGFEKTMASGSTPYGGTYVSSAGQSMVVDPSSRHRGDVIATAGSRSFVAECKAASSIHDIPGSNHDCGRACVRRSGFRLPPLLLRVDGSLLSCRLQRSPRSWRNGWSRERLQQA